MMSSPNSLSVSMENILSAVRDNNADSVAENIHKLQESVDGDYSQSVLEQVLQKAVQEGCCGVIKLLLDAMPESIDFQNMTVCTPPAILAAEAGRKDVLELLLDRGCSPNITDLELRTPLHWCSIKGHLDVVQLLVERGATVNQADKLTGFTPLSLACRHGQDSTVRFLIDHGALCNSRDAQGETPLHEAARNNGTNCLKMLLDVGANVNQPDNQGRTPVLVCALWKRIECLKALVKFNCDLDTAGPTVYSGFQTAPRCVMNPLQICVLDQQLEMADILVNAGAKTDVLNYLHIQLSALGYDHSTMEMLTKWMTSRRCKIFSLFTLCRTLIRRCIRHVNIVNAVEQLPLPTYVQQCIMLPEIILE